jgi:transcriptional regulator with XRE-family HTH domain
MVHIELKNMCREVNLTQEQLAQKLQVSPKAITNYFNGRQANADYLTKMAYQECIKQAIKRRKWEMNQIKITENGR